MADEVASVSLEADSSSFDESLDASQSKMDEWGKSITDSVGPANQLFQTLTSRVEGFSSKLVAFASSANEKLAGFADLSNEQIGKSLGTVAGAGLGSFLGPAGAQIGSLLGDQIGGALSDTVDFKALAGEAQAFLDSVRPLFDQITGWWGEVFGDAKETFGKIKDIVGELGLGDLLSGDLGTAWDKITTAFDGVVMEWEGFVNRFAARVVGAMDSLWSAVKEPLAKVADFIQRLLVRIGVLDAGTEKWGDTIRSIQEIGKTVFGAIAYAVGYVGGAQVALALPAPQVICWVLVLSLPAVLPLAWWLRPAQPASLAAWGGFVYVSLFSMWLGFFAWYRALALGGVMRVSQVQLLQPFVALLLAVPLLGERLDAATLAFALAVLAVVFVGRRMPVHAR